jgi:iron-sulfur cluster repair protein YtfE (RIC family)
LAPHFEQEERLVFSLVKPGDAEISKALAQHDELKNAIEVMKNKTTDIAELKQFADLLESHIRFEERQLFPYIEQKADPDSFDYAGKIISDHHRVQASPTWADEFWVKRGI